MPAFCPLCASDERTTEGVTVDGQRYATCSDPSHGAEPFTWEPYEPQRNRTRGRSSDGIGAELGIWDKLLECLPTGDGALSYGEVEDRFLDRFPTEWNLLIDRYGHRWRHPDKPSGQYSVSVFLASRLRELADEGLLELTWLPATGPWAYNGVISHWKRA